MSLDLDDRQRAMLQEMGVRVWLPQTPTEAPLVAHDPNAPVRRAAPSLVGVNKSSQIATPMAQPVPKPVQSVGVVAALSPMPERLPDMDWPTLARTVTNCQACALCNGRRAPVFVTADVAPQADWLVLGEPPDESEERLGLPFAEQSGQLLDNMLKSLGLNRHGRAGDRATAAYVTNVVKCRPATGRNPEPAELAACETYLRLEVALVQPKVILALGRFAAQSLLQGSRPELTSTPLGKLRGQTYHYQGVPVVVSYAPSYLLRTQQDKARAWADLCLALDLVQRGD